MANEAEKISVFVLAKENEEFQNLVMEVSHA